MPQSATQPTIATALPTSDLELAASEATSLTACVAKLELLRRTLGMDEPRAPEVELAEDERIISYSLNTALAYIKRRILHGT